MSPPLPSLILRQALQRLPLVRLHARHRLIDDLALPERFMGNLWRGEFGARLAEQAPEAFAAFMGSASTARAPAHWALHAPWADADWVPAGAVLESRLTLIGEAALTHLSAAANALAGVGQHGLGPARQPGGGAPSQRARVQCEDLLQEDPRPAAAGRANAQTEPVDLPVLSAAQLLLASPAEPERPLRLHLRSPLVFKHDGALAGPAVPPLPLLLQRIWGRLVQLLPPPPQAPEPSEPGQQPAAGRLFAPGERALWLALAEAAATPSSHTLQWIEAQRHSRRSGHDMPLAGLVGTLHYPAPAGALRPWFELADWLQLGSKASWGCGVIAVSA